MTGGRPLGEDDLQAYVDGRLPPDRRAEVDAYLAADPQAAARVAAEIADRADLRNRLAFKANDPIPSRLRIDHLIAARGETQRRFATAAMAAALCLMVGGAGGWFAAQRLRPQATQIAQARQTPVADDAILAYRTFAVEVAHPVEVAASQEAHLVQWLSRRLGQPLKAPDLQARGLKLIGGRLLPAAAGAPAAQFMYEDAQGSRSAVYVRPGGAGEPSAFRFESQGDIAAFSWMDRKLSFAVVSQTSRENLQDIAHTIYDQFEAL